MKPAPPREAPDPFPTATVRPQPAAGWARRWARAAGASTAEPPAGGYLDPGTLAADATAEQLAALAAWAAAEGLPALYVAGAFPPPLTSRLVDAGFYPLDDAARDGEPDGALYRLAPASHAELLARLPAWQPELVGTLLFLVDAGRQQVLLIRKKRGHGAGKINGPGGKLDPGETPLQAALRETREETGLRVADAEERARIRFLELDGPQWFGHVFVAHEHTGVPVETDEAKPLWAPLSALPFEQMWADDRIWLPPVLAGRRLAVDTLFRAGRLLAHRRREAPALGF